MKLKFVSELIQIASLRFIEALEGSKITMMIRRSVLGAAVYPKGITVVGGWTRCARKLAEFYNPFHN